MRKFTCISLRIAYLVSNHNITVRCIILPNNGVVLFIMVGHFALPYNGLVLICTGCSILKPLYNVCMA